MEIDKFKIGLHPVGIVTDGHHTFDHAGDACRTHVPQHTDTLVAFLHIEAAEIFIAQNGVLNAIAQVGGAEIDPFGGKFTFRGQQRQKTGAERIGASGGFDADDLFCGDFKDAHVDDCTNRAVSNQFIQHLRIGSLACGDTCFILTLTLTQSQYIFFLSFQ